MRPLATIHPRAPCRACTPPTATLSLALTPLFAVLISTSCKSGDKRKRTQRDGTCKHAFVDNTLTVDEEEVAGKDELRGHLHDVSRLHIY